MSEARVVGITILADNLAGPGFRSEHGFAAWIEVAGRRLLFDTGQGLALMENAGKLGVDLGATDTLVLSHGHYDHTGGVPFVIARAPTVEVFAHPGSMDPRYSIRDGIAKPVGMAMPARRCLEVHPVGVRWTTRSEQIAVGLGVTGPVPRLTDYEDTGGPFFVDADGRGPDPILDDQALWARTERGLVVVVGCSHAGVVNTVRYALKLSGEGALHAVLGGFHLNEASEQRLSRTMDALRELAPDHIVPCHCTGSAAVERLREAFGERVVQCHVGTVLRFGGPPGTATGAHP